MNFPLNGKKMIALKKIKDGRYINEFKDKFL